MKINSVYAPNLFHFRCGFVLEILLNDMFMDLYLFIFFGVTVKQFTTFYGIFL